MSQNRAEAHGASIAGIYDDVGLDCALMTDVPYELEEPALVRMQRIERGLHYILDNLGDLDMTLEDVAWQTGYTPLYFKVVFKQHFGMPYERFVTRLRMRQAARDICDEHFPKGMAARYGFSCSPSFSKAFKREIGVSPLQFYRGNYAVPDMPLPGDLDGLEFTLEHTIERAFVLHGRKAPPPRGAQTFLMDALALPFTGAYPQFGRGEGAVAESGEVAEGAGGAGGTEGMEGAERAGDAVASEGGERAGGAGGAEGVEGAERAGDAGDAERAGDAGGCECADDAAGEDYVGLWNYRAEAGMEYVFGPVEERLDAISVIGAEPREEGETLRIVVQGGRFAVFSYARPEDDAAIPLMQRMIARYALQEWAPMNRKATTPTNYMFERFTPDRVYLYLPMAYGMENGSELRKLAWGVEEWARHIDELIDADLNVDALADLEGYSTRNYVDVFSMYYGVTPLTYIRRRRLYLAGEELRAAGAGGRGDAGSSDDVRDAIVRKYRFTSYDQFLALRREEFGNAVVARVPIGVDGSAAGPGAPIDLAAYYESNKDRVTFAVRRLQGFQMLGHSIEESHGGGQPHDLTARVLYWFERTFPGFERFSPWFAPDGAKAFIWAADAAEIDKTAGGGGFQ